MRQVRNNVFETNSSSTHSICISKKKPVIGKFIDFHIGEYGWENACVTDTASYLYTAILYIEDNKLLNKLKNILDSHSIEYEFEEPSYDPDCNFLSYGYIDHGYELTDFISAIFNDEDLLMRYLFGDSCVYTGNDNSNDESDMCYAALPIVYDENYNKICNPNYHPEEYDYFFKGN